MDDIIDEFDMITGFVTTITRHVEVGPHARMWMPTDVRWIFLAHHN